VCVVVERRGQGKADSEVEGDARRNLIFTATEADEKADLSRSSQPDNKHRAPSSDKSRPSADKSRPVPKPRAASTSSTLDASEMKSSTPSLDRSLESDVVRPRPRARGSQESLDRPFDDPPQPQRRGSQESLDRSIDKPVAKRRPRADPHAGSADQRRPRVNPHVGSADRRPTPAMRRSQESLEGVDGPKPRARESLDRSLDESVSDASAPRPSRPQVAVKPNRKPPATRRNDRTMSSDETDV